MTNGEREEMKRKEREREMKERERGYKRYPNYDTEIVRYPYYPYAKVVDRYW